MRRAFRGGNHLRCFAPDTAIAIGQAHDFLGKVRFSSQWRHDAVGDHVVVPAGAARPSKARRVDLDRRRTKRRNAVALDVAVIVEIDQDVNLAFGDLPGTSFVALRRGIEDENLALRAIVQRQQFRRLATRRVVVRTLRQIADSQARSGRVDSMRRHRGVRHKRHRVGTRGLKL